MADLYIEKKNDVYIKVHCEEWLAAELGEYFSFYAKNYMFAPKYKADLWDGKIKLFHGLFHTMYVGLIYELIRFSIDRELSIELDPALEIGKDYQAPANVPDSFLEALKLDFEPYDYQVEALNLIVKRKRRMLLSPTSSGKSLILYMATLYLQATGAAKKTLIIVPTTSLVEQMVSDFADYAKNIKWDAEKNCHMIYGYEGVTKSTEKPIVVSTWQSIYKLPKKWFKQFDSVFVDEAHLASAESVKGVMARMDTCPYRIGLTGTIDDTETHRLTLTGLFGKIYQTTTTEQMMEREIASTLTIKGILFKHTDEECRAMSKLGYADELKHVLNDERRNKFLHKLAVNQQGNTLLLFNRVEKHGIPLFERIVKDSNGRKVFIVHGKVPVEERERIRAYAETHNNVIIVASYGTFSTGINIKNLQFCIFAHPYKAKIKNLQSIGRILRISDTSNEAVLYDVADDYQWKSRENITLKHFKERLRLYEQENFNYQVSEINL